MALWAIESIAIAGGFLSDLSIRLPTGLICVIGPRGSGKSTLAEAIRVAVGGVPVGTAKTRTDLLRANLGASVLTVTTRSDTERGGFTIRRTYGQSAILTAADARPVTAVDLDRGTFFPIDAYSSLDIEAIADESLGAKRRSLLDDLCASEMNDVHLRMSEQKRALDANAENIKSDARRISDLTEQIEELGDVRGRLDALPLQGNREGTPEFQLATKQQQHNEKELEGLGSALSRLTRLRKNLSDAVSSAKSAMMTPLAIPESANHAVLERADLALASLWAPLEAAVTSADHSLNAAEVELAAVHRALQEEHRAQQTHYLSVQQTNQEALRAFEARTSAERQVASAATFQQQKAEALSHLSALLEERKDQKAEHVLTRDKISELRERVANSLQAEAGTKVRIRVQRNADILEYQQHLTNALYGTKLKNQEDILRALSGIRPEDLAPMLRDNDFLEFDTHTSFGKERGRKIFDALRQHIDPLDLEILPIADRVIIELNVSTSSTPRFKDAAELSRGQKCTALLPILLARRNTPLVIDQPEDNLDNHFIYETVVDSIRRLKPLRQMIFITHNANIPVLGEAELVVVMNSDGQHGYVEKAGSLDECRNEIIDLLEGGEEAFELRRKRYGS